MAFGLAALLDDIAAFAKLAAASIDDVGAAAGRASAKATGVVIDDTAVTPRYVEGLAAKRELPVIKRIAIGSLRNKLLFILPAILLLSEFLPFLLTPLLMLGGTYLAFEGAEKIWGRLRGHEGHDVPAAVQGEDSEKTLVAGAVRTDLILSAEIMVIALYEVADEGFWSRLAILFVVAIVITVVVYGVVALIVKMDDIGLALAQRESAFNQRLGRGLVSGMPKVLAVVSAVGTVAMLWVGGHILLQGVDELGWHMPYELVHHAEQAIAGAVPGVGGFLAWLFNTLCSAIIGLVVGAVVVAVIHLLPFGRRDHATAHEGDTAAATAHGATPDDHAPNEGEAHSIETRAASPVEPGREGPHPRD